ncbi:hypothetical protein LTSEBAI_1836 [Salmonella enterica subsp. enterica serovar Baildon str. R6-199]|nr:hypothetical protein LTSEBAI_1836 [Salmonella enterica subsp. enterica serovar Baildon str. R6-199]
MPDGGRLRQVKFLIKKPGIALPGFFTLIDRALPGFFTLIDDAYEDCRSRW